jgi:hypothetical protein
LKYGESQQEIYRLVTKGGSARHENLCLADVDGNILAFRKSSSATEVVLDEDLLRLLRERPAGSIVSTHNHVESDSFSHFDMNIASMFPSVKETRVIGHDGTKYLLDIATGERPDYDELNTIFQSLMRNKAIRHDIMGRLRTGELATPEEAWKEHSHLINERMSKMFGWAYSRTLP